MSIATQMPATINGPGAPAILPVQSEGVHAIENAMAELKAVRTFVKRELVDGLDFGTIPGCGPKPTLLLPGAQKAAMYFNAYPDPDLTESEMGNGQLEVVAKVRLVSRASGLAIGAGVGSCSSLETKYRYRSAERTCPKCGKPTIIKGREEYGGGWLCFPKKGGCGAKFGDNDPAVAKQQVGQVENPNPHDVRNTVRKMAKKRAFVDAALSLSCLSEMFTQDIEDIYTPADFARSLPPEPEPPPDDGGGRRAVNDQFKPASKPADDRPIDAIIRAGVVAHGNHHMLNPFQVERHMLAFAADLAGVAVSKGMMQFEAHVRLTELYEGMAEPARRKCRKELARYLAEKVAAAAAESQEPARAAEDEGDPDIDLPESTYVREREAGED